ncbi:hypothetical protein SLA2020_358530 [Shorea laevis]
MTDKLEDSVSLDEEISLEAEESVGEFEFVISLQEEVSLEAGESVGETEFVGGKRLCSCSTTSGSRSNKVYKVSKEDMMYKFMECMIYALAAKEWFYKAIADRYRAADTAISSDDRFCILECTSILQIMKGISYSTARKAIAILYRRDRFLSH